jgi:hypothetical protein
MRCGLATAIAQYLGSARQRTAGPGEINYAFVDPYSLAHAAVGVMLGLLGVRLGPLLAIAVGWEVAEHVFKDLIPAVFPHPTQDTLANSTGDVLSALIGWGIAHRPAGSRAHRHSSREA